MKLLHEAPPRPDAEVLHEAVDRLERDTRFRTARVGVSVDHDVVMLTGEVESLAAKRHVEHLVHAIPGVVAVASEVVAVRPGDPRTADHELARAAAELLRAEPNVSSEDLEVIVSHGVVRLEGRVDWPYQRAHAVRAIGELSGVERVENRIRLTERVKRHDVRRGIEAAMQAEATRTARRIQVALDDNRVTLTGTVRTLKERDDVERAAWHVTGVLDVCNRLEITA
jgi:osmotically-inducible protein OsmY